jgi:hypothetical protein
MLGLQNEREWQVFCRAGAAAARLLATDALCRQRPPRGGTQRAAHGDREAFGA